MDEKRIYICIDLKSFYASVECVERGLDPLLTNLVVADVSRTEKTICLAVTPSLKSYGISSRARLFEVVQAVNIINKERLKANNYKPLKNESFNHQELLNNPTLKLSYIAATPRMALYEKYSTKIYVIYLKYISKDDIHVYSIDEVFIDVTKYLKTYKMTARKLAAKMIKEVFDTTGITATCGIGSNMYLAKVAMDIVAKKVKPDNNGVRMAELDEMSYRKELWNHTPLTDFWRIGKGYAKKLTTIGLETMGDIARISINNEKILYDIFGINAELLIDHAWGYEPTTMEDVKSYTPENHSLSTGQVLHSPYNNEDAKLIVKEMADQLSMDLLTKQLCTNQLVLAIGYDTTNDLSNYTGTITIDYLGREMAKPAHSSIKLKKYTSSTQILVENFCKLYDKITDKTLLIRRINLCCITISINDSKVNICQYEQLDIFTNYDEKDKEKIKKQDKLEKEKNLQQTILDIKNKYGKNAVVKGMNLEKGATMIERNSQIGGHKA